MGSQFFMITAKFFKIMNTKISVPSIKAFLNKIDWQLLLFLLLVLQVKLAGKVAGILLIYLLHWNFRFDFKIKNSRLPLFYPAIIVIAFIGFLLNKSFSNFNYDVEFITGITFWILCIFAIHQVKLFIERNDTETINKTIIAFFILNAIVSGVNFLLIIWETGAINPYIYQGEYQKYFINTGDYIKGITFDTSTTNALLNALGIIYFLMKKNVQMVLLCMIVLVLTASNFTYLLMLVIFFGLFLFKSDKNLKSVIVICILMFVIFWGKISPQNDNYVSDMLGKFFPQKKENPVMQKTAAEKTEDSIRAIIIPITRREDSIRNILIQQEIKTSAVKDKPQVVSAILAGKKFSIPEPDINKASYQVKNDTSDLQKILFQFINDNKNNLPLSENKNAKWTLPGKVIAFEQTFIYMRDHPQKIFFGDGMGNFSSKLAFRATALKIGGGYSGKYKYISPEFLANHLDIYLYFFSRQKGLHSVINSPDSAYDQLFRRIRSFWIIDIWDFLCRIFC